MDYLFKDTIFNIPENNVLSSCYIIDNSLKYVSLHSADMFYLHYVDTDIIGEMVRSDAAEGSFDYQIVSLNSPVKDVKSSYAEIRDIPVRVVRIDTVTGNIRTLKPKESSTRNIISRHFTKKNKLL